MSSTDVRDVPIALVAVAGVLVLVSFAYAVLTAHLFLWLMAVVASGAMVAGGYLLYLFYRLVVATERIADET